MSTPETCVALVSPAVRPGAGKQAAGIVRIIVDLVFLSMQLCFAFVEALYRLIVPVPENSVKGDVVLITGAAHGIGRELAIQYATQGATVVCWDLNREANEETVKKIASLGCPRAYAYTCDISKREHVLTAAEAVQRDVGDIDILINNAGIMVTRALLEHTAEDLQKTIDTNVVGHFWTLQAFLPTMLKNNRGHVVCVSSLCGKMGMGNLTAYSASKFALCGLMDALANELREKPNCNIKLTTVCPYGVDTGMCKTAVHRFPNFMGFLQPRDVAQQIMMAQRRELVELSVPTYLGIMPFLLQLLPPKGATAVRDFAGSYIKSDL